MGIEMTTASTIGIIAAGLLTATSALAQDRTFDLTGFDEVSVASGVTTNVTVGPDFSVVAEAVRGDIDRLEVDLQSGTLAISRKNGWRLFSFGREDRFIVTM